MTPQQKIAYGVTGILFGLVAALVAVVVFALALRLFDWIAP